MNLSFPQTLTHGACTAHSSGEPAFSPTIFFISVILFDENILFTLSEAGTEKGIYTKVCLSFLTIQKKKTIKTITQVDHR
jgi:hypothetical protein